MIPRRRGEAVRDPVRRYLFAALLEPDPEEWRALEAIQPNGYQRATRAHAEETWPEGLLRVVSRVAAFLDEPAKVVTVTRDYAGGWHSDGAGLAAIGWLWKGDPSAGGRLLFRSGVALPAGHRDVAVFLRDREHRAEAHLGGASRWSVSAY